AVLNNPPDHGTLDLQADGSFTYQPDANYHGPDSFSYQADDGYGLSPAAVVSLTVTSVNDAPAAVDDSYLLNLETAADPGGELIVAAPGVLANDTDVDTGDTLTAALSPADSNVQLQPDGSFVFTPPSGYTGEYTFTYQVSDGHTSTTATVSIQVDTQTPDVQWLLPAGLEGGGAVFPASPFGSTITLEFSVTDNSPLSSVSLKIWDTNILDYIVFQAYPAAPYRTTFRTDDLPNIGYNQLRVYAYDTAGNLGTSYVFIYNPQNIYFPVIAK
ncbi:MAG: cadherin-like domain-containing protein, partial [Anaerolineales bacterium]